MFPQIGTFLITLWVAVVLGQTADSSKIEPLAQFQGDNLNPDFSESEALAYFPPNEKWWFAWDVGTGGNRNIYVKSRGLEDDQWSTETAITSEAFINQNPDVESFGDSVLIVWESNMRSNFDVMYSIFDGNLWSEPQLLTQDSVDNRNPTLHTYKLIGQRTFEAIVVWERMQNLYWSKFDRQDWSAPTLFPTQNDSAKSPNISREHSLPFLVWEGLQDSNWDIYGSWFVPDSSYWVPPVRLTTDAEDDRNPQVGAADIYYVPAVQSFSGSVSLVWQTNRDNNWEIYSGIYYVSDGPPLFNVENLTRHDSSDVQPAAKLTIQGDVFFTVSAWQSNRTGKQNVYTNDILPHPDSMLSGHPRYSRFLDLQYWLAWESQRNDHWEIWASKIIPIIDNVEQATDGGLPSDYQLFQNYPNPFNSGTVIPFSLLKPTYVEIEILNIRGQRVRTLLADKTPAGNHQIDWDAKDQHGILLQSGVYFIRLITGNQMKIIKALLLK